MASSQQKAEATDTVSDAISEKPEITGRRPLVAIRPQVVAMNEAACVTRKYLGFP